jgi:hypothetical protein
VGEDWYFLKGLRIYFRGPFLLKMTLVSKWSIDLSKVYVLRIQLAKHELAVIFL